MAGPQSKEPGQGFVKCRVVAPTWGAYSRGAIVDATPREVEQTTHRDRSGKVVNRALLPLDEEQKQAAASARPDDSKRVHESDLARRKAWSDLSADAERINREADARGIERMLEARGLLKGGAAA